MIWVYRPLDGHCISARPWAGLPIQVPRNAQALFDVAVDHVLAW